MTSTSTPITAPCPCGGHRYQTCCGRFHTAQAIPSTARELMQSRYSAYVMALHDYLLQTWHHSTRPDHSNFLNADDAVKWMGLTVKQHIQTDEASALVEFIARYKPVGSGRAERLHETSRFTKENGRWFYVDGDIHTTN